MPFDTGFRIYPWVEKLLAIRHRPLLAHVLAIILVLIAVVVREAVAEATGPHAIPDAHLHRREPKPFRFATVTDGEQDRA